MGSIGPSSLGPLIDAQSLLEQVNILGKQLPTHNAADSKVRKELKEAALKLSIALETPGESIQRIAYLPGQTAAVRVGIELGIFEVLAKGGNAPKSTAELAETANVNPDLLQRFLRYLAAQGVIGEVNIESWVPTNVTRALTNPNLRAGVVHTFDLVGSCFHKMPDWLIEHDFKTPAETHDCPFQPAFGTKQDLFEWFPSHPQFLNNFNSWMAGQREGREGWLEFYDFEKEIIDGFEKGKGEGTLVVDIGGARGHELQAIRQKFPNLPGRLILQDLPETVKQAPTDVGFEPQVHDFFTPEPIIGARVYYLRNVLHDWPNTQCTQILTHIAHAMTRNYSKLLLNEMVVPNQGAGIVACQIDMTMLSVLASEERTENQWRALLDTAGLKVRKIWALSDETESIIEAELA